MTRAPYINFQSIGGFGNAAARLRESSNHPLTGGVIFRWRSVRVWLFAHVKRANLVFDLTIAFSLPLMITYPNQFGTRSSMPIVRN
jgi:hypothetical protein